ncbi:MAG TPA: malto-oligosyltrehalose trehalohydrolase [Microvirga sp.]|jgi:maltooligosyltrehalose trehalohydrolase|nr:malto-oligosyltrehalose trehalohydrolase [Microvirga sp.]
MPFGAEMTAEGVRFALWAPTAGEVALVLDGADHPMPDQGDGWRRLVVPDARAGSRYGFRIDRDLLVPDPASRFQPDDVHRESLVVDPGAYAWQDAAWTGRPWEETVLYEVHVGTATPEGTYAGLMGKLEELRDVGVTAIELLPVNEFPGRRNWGYDGVLPYAPDAAYGTPDDLKRLVDRAHGLGLMVFLDVVYNHFGPSGNYLQAYAKTFFTDRHPTPWGAGINVDGNDARPVRDFFIHNALYWLEEFHVDGLRFDAVHAIVDDGPTHFLEELATRIRAAAPRGREVHLVLENEANQARWLGRDDAGRPRLHTAQWADDSHNSWHPLLTGEAEGYYEDFADKPVERLGRALAEGFVYQNDPSRHHGGKRRGEPSSHLPPSAFVGFLQNHDQVGNRAFGERLSDLVDPGRLALARALFLLSPQVPLLFQGEDWAATAPFQFFVDFESEPDLAEAVRNGRRREFAKFKAFADPETRDRIPDPTAISTFENSRLDWGEAARAPHREIRAETRALLRLRQEAVVPLTKSPYRGGAWSMPQADALDILWRFEAGHLRLVANFGTSEAAFSAPGLAPVWSSPEARREGDRMLLPAWTGAVLRGVAA